VRSEQRQTQTQTQTQSHLLYHLTTMAAAEERHRLLKEDVEEAPPHERTSGRGRPGRHAQVLGAAGAAVLLVLLGVFRGHEALIGGDGGDGGGGSGGGGVPTQLAATAQLQSLLPTMGRRVGGAGSGGTGTAGGRVWGGVLGRALNTLNGGGGGDGGLGAAGVRGLGVAGLGAGRNSVRRVNADGTPLPLPRWKAGTTKYCPPRQPTTHLNPHLVSRFLDVESNICQALARHLIDTHIQPSSLE